MQESSIYCQHIKIAGPFSFIRDHILFLYFRPALRRNLSTVKLLSHFDSCRVPVPCSRIQIIVA
jgi:hypothetical protein